MIWLTNCSSVCEKRKKKLTPKSSEKCTLHMLKWKFRCMLILYEVLIVFAKNQDIRTNQV